MNFFLYLTIFTAIFTGSLYSQCDSDNCTYDESNQVDQQNMCENSVVVEENYDSHNVSYYESINDDE